MLTKKSNFKKLPFILDCNQKPTIKIFKFLTINKPKLARSRPLKKKLLKYIIKIYKNVLS